MEPLKLYLRSVGSLKSKPQQYLVKQGDVLYVLLQRLEIMQGCYRFASECFLKEFSGKACMLPIDATNVQFKPLNCHTNPSCCHV
jgi:hypothetical protein